MALVVHHFSASDYDAFEDDDYLREIAAAVVEDSADLWIKTVDLGERDVNKLDAWAEANGLNDVFGLPHWDSGGSRWWWQPETEGEDKDVSMMEDGEHAHLDTAFISLDDEEEYFEQDSLDPRSHSSILSQMPKTSSRNAPMSHLRRSQTHTRGGRGGSLSSTSSSDIEFVDDSLRMDTDDEEPSGTTFFGQHHAEPYVQSNRSATRSSQTSRNAEVVPQHIGHVESMDDSINVWMDQDNSQDGSPAAQQSYAEDDSQVVLDSQSDDENVFLDSAANSGFSLDDSADFSIPTGHSNNGPILSRHMYRNTQQTDGYDSFDDRSERAAILKSAPASPVKFPTKARTPLSTPTRLMTRMSTGATSVDDSVDDPTPESPTRSSSWARPPPMGSPRKLKPISRFRHELLATKKPIMEEEDISQDASEIMSADDMTMYAIQRPEAVHTEEEEDEIADWDTSLASPVPSCIREILERESDDE
ncbi:hypothetical protein CYLTODRAFT_490124 [Cylindrobasidium torrendii FP15055 ss-10]|uniref:Uncharacterized protein n=1 Tax=Cylindrobasidium torrendii FP15055 ss-10 TaxID=1314674 RepID=A0A0D7BD05_9AGAR|nr:hypothetical protein CYLTODRAFT_490124 [Cylindrobasidium torrendii FP15055 ss-10]